MWRPNSGRNKGEAVDEGKRIAILNYTGEIPHHGCEIVSHVLTREFMARGVNVVHLPIGRDWENSKAELFKCNAIVINGEGTFHDSSKIASKLLRIVPECKKRQIPVFLINSLWQNNNSEMVRHARDLTGIFVRESASQAELRKAGLESSVVPDLTLRLSQKISPSTSRKSDSSFTIYFDSVSPDISAQIYSSFSRDDLGVLISMAPNNSDHEQTSESFLQVSDPPIWSRTITKRNNILRMLPRIFDSFLKQTKTRVWNLRRPVKSGQHVSQAHLFELLRSAKLAVSGRFHGVCLSMVMGTPFIAAGTNSHKTAAMLKDAGLEHRFVSDLESLGYPTRDPIWTKADNIKVLNYLGWAVKSQDKMIEQILNTESIPRTQSEQQT